MNILGYIFFVTLLMLGSGFAEENDFIFPREIHEYENAMIVVKGNAPFTFEINEKCMGINVLKNITKNGKNFQLTGDSGYIEIDNKCFVDEEIIITVRTGKKELKKKYKLLPPIVEERDWGC